MKKQNTQKEDSLSKQKEILKIFLSLYNYPTLKSMSQVTSIHPTRLHRIIKGQEMKFSEFIIIDNMIKNRNAHYINDKSHYSLTMLSLLVKFPDKTLEEIKSLLEYKLKQQQLLNI
jgi:hypothetical protein